VKHTALAEIELTTFWLLVRRATSSSATETADGHFVHGVRRGISEFLQVLQSRYLLRFCC